MAVPFGFSVGDFIATLGLVTTVVDALRESGNSSQRYRELIRELFSLETALIQVKSVEFHESQSAERNALHGAAAQCQRTIDQFWKKIEMDMPHLANNGCPSRLKATWAKVRWAVFKEDEVEKFKADLRGHTGSITVLLAAIQMQKTSREQKQQTQERQSLLALVQQNANMWMTSTAQTSGQMKRSTEQGKQVLNMTSKILQTNVQIFKAMMDVQNHIKSQVPCQVRRQQPVYLIDALGKDAPFHLEFIRSSKALLAVLRDNFIKAGASVEKIDNKQFSIQDSVTRQDIDLDGDWDNCFFPGQRVEQNVIVFSENLYSRCLACGASVPEERNKAQVECQRCGVFFTQEFDLDTSESEPSPDHESTEDSVKNRRTNSILPVDIRTSQRMQKIRRLRVKVEMARQASLAVNVPPHADPNQGNFMDASAGLDFANMDFANPLTTNDVLGDFDFDSFLETQEGVSTGNETETTFDFGWTDRLPLTLNGQIPEYKLAEYLLGKVYEEEGREEE